MALPHVAADIVEFEASVAEGITGYAIFWVYQEGDRSKANYMFRTDDDKQIAYDLLSTIAIHMLRAFAEEMPSRERVDALLSAACMLAKHPKKEHSK